MPCTAMYKTKSRGEATTLLCQSEGRVKCKCELTLLIYLLFNIFQLENPASLLVSMKRGRDCFSIHLKVISRLPQWRERKKESLAWVLLGGLVVRIQCFHCGGLGSALVREHPASRVTSSKKKNRQRKILALRQQWSGRKFHVQSQDLP